jgi:hypothetical protein
VIRLLPTRWRPLRHDAVARIAAKRSPAVAGVFFLDEQELHWHAAFKACRTVNEFTRIRNLMISCHADAFLKRCERLT